MHGPLQAVLLADAVEQAYAHRFVSGFSFRAIAPAFDDQPLHLRLACAPDEAGSIQITAEAFSGARHTMTATATLAPE